MARPSFAFQGTLLVVGALIAAATPCACAEEQSYGQVRGFFSQAAVVGDGSNIAGNSQKATVICAEVTLYGSPSIPSNQQASFAPIAGRGDNKLTSLSWPYIALPLAHRS
jgi:hypothetical protein